MLKEQSIAVRETVHDSAGVIEDIHFGSVQGRPIVTSGHLDTLAGNPHLVCSIAFPARHRLWNQLSRQRGKTAELDALGLPERPSALRKQPHLQDGVTDLVRSQLLCVLWVN